MQVAVQSLHMGLARDLCVREGLLHGFLVLRHLGWTIACLYSICSLMHYSRESSLVAVSCGVNLRISEKSVLV